MFAFGSALALWSANAGMKALIDALNVSYNEKGKARACVQNCSSAQFFFGQNCSLGSFYLRFFVQDSVHQ
jgi:membrane protein